MLTLRRFREDGAPGKAAVNRSMSISTHIQSNEEQLSAE